MATFPLFTDPRASAYAHQDLEEATQFSCFGFHHGPIATTPPVRAIPTEPNTVEMTGWDDTSLKLSKVQGGVCWLEVGAGRMCGMVFDNAPSLYRHMRLNVANNPRGNIVIAEKIVGEQAIRKYVRDQHWRHADFLYEPGRGPLGGIIDNTATQLESIAALDPVFAEHFGTRFHRDTVISMSRSGERGL
ncbi:hypothetical protein BDV29DRAFT_151620 [Aspergillus leporis]|uniref:Uncharacterized protein n=1 Tax=Aspergillus leporis TaxID=41062 RepID=A0A5N5XJL1_9EURO|nr:hypothetical protein BDV29DRAFT_151620 [Aspergillus leporis]